MWILGLKGLKHIHLYCLDSFGKITALKYFLIIDYDLWYGQGFNNMRASQVCEGLTQFL